MALRSGLAVKTPAKVQQELEDLQLVLKARNGSSAALDTTWITLNAARGGVGGTGGTSGEGIGGGLYIDAGANVTLSKSTEVIFNFASTKDDNIFGTYTKS